MKLLAAVALLLIVWWLKHASDPERFPEPAWDEEPDGVQPFDVWTLRDAA